MTSRLRRPLRRGYMLLEVMIGGAMTAVVVMTVLTQIAQARAQNITTGRDVTAAQLVLEKMEEQRLASAWTAATETVASVNGMYTRTVAVAACTETVGSLSLTCNDVTVTVTFPTNDGKVHSVAATIRVYP
jgi:hypothetical protein